MKGCAKIYDSLERCKQYLDELSAIVTKGRKLPHPKSSLEDPHTILLESKLKGEIGYGYILEVFDRMRIKLEYFRVQFASHPTVKAKELEELELNLLLERYQFLKETAIVNQLLIARSIQEQSLMELNVSSFSPKSEVTWV